MAIIPRLQEDKAWYDPRKYEFGASEKLANYFGQGRTAQGGSNMYGNQTATTLVPSNGSGNSFTQSGANGAYGNSGRVLGTTTTNTYSPPPANLNQNSGGGFSGGSTPPPAPGPQGPTGPSEMDVINEEFNSFQSYLGDQEGLAKGNFNNTQSSIFGERDQSLQKTENERVIRDTELTNQGVEGRKSEALNLAKVRQLLADLDQRNNARMAISGGGSVADALSDKFARTSQQSAGGVLQEGQRFQNDVTVQKQRAEQFYGEKKAQIEGAAQQAVNQARQVLDQNIAAINGERRASAAEKSRAKLGAWQSYLGKVNEAKVQAASFQAQYDMWRQQQQANLQEAAGYTPQLQSMDFSNYYFNPQAPTITAPNQGIPQVAPTYYGGVIRRPDEENYITPAIGA